LPGWKTLSAATPGHDGQDSVLGCDLNQQFHFALVDIAGLPFLQGILYRIWLQMGPLIAAVYQQGGSDMIDYHYPVLAAIRQRRPGGRQRHWR
jgi:DNA-binding GntR family transcriptional regulator